MKLVRVAFGTIRAEQFLALAAVLLDGV